MAENFKWEGKRISKLVEKAAGKAIDTVLVKAVTFAKFNHPGWNNITGVAEGSVRILQHAKFSGGVGTGLWGSKNVHYVIWLELNHGAAMRRAAELEYREFPKLMKEAFKSVGF